MKHPSDELIITFLYNEAGTDEIRLIGSHMAECMDCALKINAMKKTINAVNGLKDEETPIFLADKIAAGFENDRRHTINKNKNLNDKDLSGKCISGDNSSSASAGLNIDQANNTKILKSGSRIASGKKDANFKTASRTKSNASSDTFKANSNKKTSNIKDEAPVISEIMTPGELADFLKIPLEGIYDLLSDIPYLTLAGQIRFRRSSVEKWLEIREKNPVMPKQALRDLDDSPKLWLSVV